MFKFNVVAKYTPTPEAGTVNMLDSKGKSCTLYYRLTILGFSTGWTSVKFVENFPK